ncbi:MAG TPA: hypothetical protein PK604_12200 [Acetivibrio clariflavus]|nr:hypothetical protein [Acetivibrio clariflavus]
MGGKVSFLPLGDNDDYDWQSEEIDLEQLMDIIDKKEKQNEVIGVILYWDKSSIGMQLLFGELWVLS